MFAGFFIGGRVTSGMVVSDQCATPSLVYIPPMSFFFIGVHTTNEEKRVAVSLKKKSVKKIV